MLKVEVKVGEVYQAKIGGHTCRVKILQEKISGGQRRGCGLHYPRIMHWLATNLHTGKQVEIKSASKLSIVAKSTPLEEML